MKRVAEMTVPEVCAEITERAQRPRCTRENLTCARLLAEVLTQVLDAAELAALGAKEASACAAKAAVELGDLRADPLRRLNP